jgi:hypothetical protein
MLDYQRIVDDVRASLYATGTGASETVRAAAAEYAHAGDEINQRLRRCGELLKAGLRSEALQQCEILPNLLDVVATLDFPERDYWAQLCNYHGIFVPPPLQMDVAADLNEAYAIEQPLETLMSRHRLLALAHSPLKMRVKTLRDLAEVDRDNPIWREDLITFERERQKEIQQEAAGAAAKGDAVAVAQLERELRKSPWIDSPPPKFFDWIVETKNRLNNKQAREQLTQIALELNKAFVNRESGRARELADQWSEISTGIGLSDQDTLWQTVTAPLDWLASEEEQQARLEGHLQHVAALEAALDMNKPLPVLERLYQTASRDGYELPAGLEPRYRRTAETIRRTEHRRKTLRWTAISTAAVALLGTAGYFIFQSIRQSEIDDRATALQKLLDSKKVVDAEQYAARLKNEPTWLTGAPAVADQIARLESIQKKEADRRHAFEMHLQDTETASVTDRNSLGQARKALSDARALATTETEKADVKRLELELAALERNLQKEDDDRFNRALEPLAAAVQSLESQTNLPADQRQQQASSLSDKLSALKRGAANVSPAALGQVDPLIARLKTIDDTIRAQRASLKALDDVTATVGNIDRFRDALKSFAAAYPDLPRSAQFRAVAEEAPLWAGLEKYSQLAAAWHRKNHQDLDPKTAKQFVEAAQPVLKELPDFPDAAAYRERIPYLEAITRRLDDSGSPPYLKLRAQLTKPWMSSLWLLETRTGLRYYLKEKAEITGQYVKTVKYVADFDLSQKPVGLKPEDVVSVDTAPQTALAGKSIEWLNYIDSAAPQPRWEKALGELAQLLHDDEKTEPLLRLILLQQVLETGGQGSQCFATAFEPHRAHLDGAMVNIFANWLDPNDPDALAAHRQAERVLKSTPDVKAAREQTNELWASLSQPVGATYRWIGWLARDEQGRWQCRTNDKPRQQGDIVIACRSGGGNQVVVERVGKIRGETITIEPSSSPQALVEGRPLFVTDSK